MVDIYYKLYIPRGISDYIAFYSLCHYPICKNAGRPFNLIRLSPIKKILVLHNTQVSSADLCRVLRDLF